MFKHFLFVLVCAMNCTLIGEEMSRPIQSFSQVTIKTHPAVKYVLDFLESLKQKDIEAFAH